MNTVLSASKAAVIGGSLFLLVACHSDEITAPAIKQTDFSRPLELSAGTLFDVDVFEGSAGRYVTPPSISTSSVVFLGTEVPPQTSIPSGQTRRFHFRATQPGTAVINFVTEFTGGPFADTIVVR